MKNKKQKFFLIYLHHHLPHVSQNLEKSRRGQAVLYPGVNCTRSDSIPDRDIVILSLNFYVRSITTFILYYY